MSSALAKGATIGILGSGQLGRMLAQAAKRLGFQTHVYSPEAGSPAEAVADQATVAAYDDADALAAFGRGCAVVTLEFENIPYESGRLLENVVPVRPSPECLYAAQHRGREKTFLRKNGFPVVPFEFVSSDAFDAEAVRRLGFPSVLKTAGFGYDGKGQHRVDRLEAVEQLLTPGQDWVLERWQELDREISVIVARGQDGKTAHWGAIENAHRNHILDVSVAPARVDAVVAARAVETATAICEKLGLVGLLCVEFFLTRSGELLVNEMAPRPHNSGHWTIEGARTSQFEQGLRAVCGLPLGDTSLVAPTAMANLLGDLWEGGEPNWAALKKHSDVVWHDYGKKQARPGRKMGHLTAVGSSPEDAVAKVTAARAALKG